MIEMMHEGLLIIGAGGHGRVAADIASRSGRYKTIGFLDDGEPKHPLRYPHLGKVDDAVQFLDRYDVFVAIGNVVVRQRIQMYLEEQGAQIATLIAKEAVVSADVVIGKGSIIMPGAIVNIGAQIGQGVILNTASSVDHDCVVGDYCHVAVGAHLCGEVTVGSGVWIGAGATVIQCMQICSDTTVGAGAVVVKNIQEKGTYLGVPARRII